MLAAPLFGVVVVIFVTAPYALLWLRRAQEFEADRLAADLGYRAGLVAALRNFVAGEEKKPARFTSLRRVTSTHPELRLRVAALEALAGSVEGE